MTRLERWSIAAFLIGMTCTACAPPQALVPLVPRPDTRRIVSFNIDSSVARVILEQLAASLPNEQAMCLAGRLERRHEAPAFRHVEVESARAAQADSVDEYHVYLPARPTSGCAGRGTQIVAHLHDHTEVPPDLRCTHSDPDVMMLFNDVRLLFSLVFCQDGRGEVLFQDGRRGEFRWAP